ncbi:MAG: YbaN family protein [Planctomycetes bacterium]|nr:YbaN family protein [Planctomycetota bacterium]
MHADPEADPEPAGRTLRALWIAVGVLLVALGMLGALLPVLPTTPFLLLAAACFARGSPRLLARLQAHPTFGPAVRGWREQRALPRRARRPALLLVVVSFALSIVAVELHLVRALLFVVGVGLFVFLARLPVIDADAV